MRTDLLARAASVTPLNTIHHLNEMMTRMLLWLNRRWIPLQQTAGKWLINYNQQHDSTVTRLVFLAWIAIIGMPLYYGIWSYWFPQPYENLGLRIFGVALCFPAIFAHRYSQKKWLPAYFFIGLTYVLPFFFTFMYLMNEGSSVWSESLLIALILLFHFDATLAFLSYIVGTCLAYLVFVQFKGEWMPINPQEWQQLPIQLFAIFTVSLAKVGRKVLSQEKLTGMASGLATVAHELRTPLLSIEANTRGMKRLFAGIDKESQSQRTKLEQAAFRIEIEVRYMNNAIDLLLLNSSTGKQNLHPTEVISMTSAVELMLQRYPFENHEQRELVTLEVLSDFQLKGREDLCSMILINLMSNALKAIHRAGKGRIHIIVDGTNDINQLAFSDTGGGISAAQLPHIFTRFYTYPENSGTGIGLAFCKQVLDAWGASIQCYSIYNDSTRFVLSFPKTK
ncbi:MAG: HAMP domain-containing sensor histidine kinase [Gallionella sp.]